MIRTGITLKNPTFREYLTQYFTANLNYSNEDMKVYALKSEEGLPFSPYRIFVWQDLKKRTWNIGYLLPYHSYRFTKLQFLLEEVKYSRAARFFALESLQFGASENELLSLVLRASNPQDVHIMFNLAFPSMNKAYKYWEEKIEELQVVLAQAEEKPYSSLAHRIFIMADIPHHAQYYTISTINYVGSGVPKTVGLKISLNPRASVIRPWHAPFEYSIKGTTCRLISAKPGSAIISHIPTVLGEYNGDFWSEETISEELLYQKRRTPREALLNIFRS